MRMEQIKWVLIAGAAAAVVYLGATIRPLSHSLDSREEAIIRAHLKEMFSAIDTVFENTLKGNETIASVLKKCAEGDFGFSGNEFEIRLQSRKVQLMFNPSRALWESRPKNSDEIAIVAPIRLNNGYWCISFNGQSLQSAMLPYWVTNAVIITNK